MPTYVNDNGTWREVNESLSVHDGGSYREIDEGYVNDNGTWRLIYNAEQPIWETTTFRLGGYKSLASGSTIGSVGWNAGQIFVSPIPTQIVYGSLGDELELLDTTIIGTLMSNGNVPALVWGIASQTYGVSTSFLPYGLTQPNSSNSFPKGSIATNTFTTASNNGAFPSGSSNTAGSSVDIEQLYITPNTLQGFVPPTNRIFLAIDVAYTTSLWPAYHMKITIPGGNSNFQALFEGVTNNPPAQGGRNTAPVVKAISTSDSWLEQSASSSNGNIETDLYNSFNGFSGQNVPVTLYDLPNFPFKSSSGGVEYRTILKLDWGITSTTQSVISMFVEGHGLPADAWSRLEINGVSLDVSLFSKSETNAIPGISPPQPAYTTWSYVYQGNAKVAFGDARDTISLNIYKRA